MASVFSGNLTEQYYKFYQSRAPFGQPLHASQLTTCGPMSFAPQMHGSFPSHPSFMDRSMMSMNSPSSMDMSEATAQNIATMQAKLNKKLGPEFISQRPGPGGGPKLTYAEGWKVINLANEVFGFNGWSSSVVNMNTDYIDYSEETRRFTVGVSAVIRVTLRDGVFHEDVGYGMLENSRSKGAALDKCKKEAVTDGVKRALRNFGNLLGNCLYDKQYTQEIVKIKVPPPKFDKSALHRRPEFDESNTTTNQSNVPTTANASSASTSITPPKLPIPPVIPKAIGNGSYSSVSKSNTSTNNTSRQLSAVPQHMRPNATSTPARSNVPLQGAQGQAKNGLNTPVQTPLVKAGPSGGALPQAPIARNVASPSLAPINQARQPNQQQPAKQPQKPVAPPPPVQHQPIMPAKPAAAAPPQSQRPQAVSLKDLDKHDMHSFSYYDDDDDDDDELLAALDLVEGQGGFNETEADMGRPIDNEEGVGGAIDFDEGTRGIAAQDDRMASSGTKTVSDGMLSDTGAPAQGFQQQNQNHVRFTAKPAQGAYGGQKQQQSDPQRGTLTSREMAGNNSNGNSGAPQHQQQNTIRANPAPQRFKDENGASNFNVPPPSSKPHTPSMGGFSFTSEASTATAPTSSATRPQPGMTAQAGVKRNIDTMNSTSSGRGPGMGLAQAQARAQAGVHSRSGRQVFAPLGVQDGGDPKRLRR